MKDTKMYGVFTLLLAVMFLSLSTAQAQDSYRFEAGAIHHYSEDDDDVEVKVMGIGGAFYFQPVNTADHPLAEAAFLERVGNVMVQTGIGTLEGDFQLDADVAMIGAEVEYMQPGQPLYLEAMSNRMIVDLNSPGDGDMTMDTFGVGAGWFIQDGFRVGVGYVYEEDDIDITAPMVLNQTKEYKRFNVNGKMVKKLSGEMAFNAEAMISYEQYDDEVDDGSNNVVSLSGDFYFNRKISAGAGLIINRGDDESAEGETFSLNFTNFFTPRFYIDVDVARFEADNNTAGTDEDSLDLLLALRF